ncbi:MAG: hypothetical protein SWX82_35065 [Cyanobacteriota bacterium]|nr:hypothetical protein [Cyanobacteriota bacterium]
MVHKFKEEVRRKKEEERRKKKEGRKKVDKSIVQYSSVKDFFCQFRNLKVSIS